MGILECLDANGGKELFIYANFFRKRLAIGPDRAVFKVFFLPYRYGLFQGIDQPAARLKCCPPMRRRHPDQDACLSNFQPAQAMNQADIPDFKTLK
jgi:hypothetical protein